MALTSAQVKGRIKNVAKNNHADPRALMRIYAMERFLERVANSKYRDKFVIKGGILVTALVGVEQRATMDIDTSIRNENLSSDDAKRIINEIKDIRLDDGMTFELKSVEDIMDEMEYPGIRVHMNAYLEEMNIPLKIDISTGDVITPRAVHFDYPLLLEDRSISLWSYNLETVLGEKLQTILARGILNTRMRDFYDIHTLLSMYKEKIDPDTFREAFIATCKKRGTDHLGERSDEILKTISNDANLQKLWESYRKKYSYASDITFEQTIGSIRELIEI